MTKPLTPVPPGSTKQDKGDATTAAANSIISAERSASDAKVARLKALRLAAAATEPAPAAAAPAAKAPVAKRARQPKSSALRKIALSG